MRWFLELAYDGSAFRGWQRQKQGERTVQGVLEDALGLILGGPTEVVGAGRTDAGVHATMYVAHFDGPELESDFLRRLNSVLPEDIAVWRVWRCDGHARFDAREREYAYYITMKKNPFRRDFAWFYSVPLDIEAMNAAATKLLTISDFTTFAKLGGGNKTNICRVSKASWRVNGDELVFTIRADRFLRNMVRAIVGTLVDVGRGKITVERFCEIVDARDLSLASGGAPACGLFLTGVWY